MSGPVWSCWITSAAVKMPACIAAAVSYSPVFELAQGHGEPERRAALFPMAGDGMVIASSMALPAHARRGAAGECPPPWTLLIPGSLASLAANVAVAEPTAWSAVIRARPSSALAGAFELLTRERRREQGASSENAAGEPDGAASPTTIEPERPGRTER